MNGRGCVAVLLACTAAMSAAGAAEVVLAEGEIAIGNPLGTRAGVSEMANDCGQDRRLDGIDGITFAVPAAARTRPATLATTPASADANVYWFDANCRPVGTAMDQAGTGNETGTVPANAVSGVVNLVSGLDATVRLTYRTPN